MFSNLQKSFVSNPFYMCSELQEFSDFLENRRRLIFRRIWFLTFLITIILKNKYRCACTIFFEPSVEYKFVHNKVVLCYYTNPVLLYAYLFCLYVIMIATCHAPWGSNFKINSILCTKNVFFPDQIFYKFEVYFIID